MTRPPGTLPALAAAALLVVGLAAAVAPVGAASSVFTATGKSLVLSTPEWTLMSSLSDAGGGAGVFMNATAIFSFAPPKIKGPVSKDGTTVKRATTVRFRRIVLTPVMVTATGLQPVAGADAPLLTMSVKLPKGTLTPSSTSVVLPVQGSAFPYAVVFGGQAGPTLLTPNTGAKILGKPTLKYGKAKPVKISTASPAFQLATAGSASAVCIDGYGGLLSTKSGCAQCAAGSYASRFDQSTPCKLCSTVSSSAYADKAGAAACKECAPGQTPSADRTTCTGGTTTATTAYLLTAPGACSDAVRAQIKGAQEAALKSQPGVQAATVNVTCSEYLARRRHLLQPGTTRAAYFVAFTCVGATPDSCSTAFAAWITQLKSCCSASPSATCGASVPQGCTSASFGNYDCPRNTYIKNGVCAPCGSGASSSGAVPNTIVQSVSCGCQTGANYITTSDTCACTNGATYSLANGCSTGGGGSTTTPTVKAVTNLIVESPKCTQALIDTTKTAYENYLNAQDGVVKAVVTVTCTELGTGRKRFRSLLEEGTQPKKVVLSADTVVTTIQENLSLGVEAVDSFSQDVTAVWTEYVEEKKLDNESLQDVGSVISAATSLTQVIEQTGTSTIQKDACGDPRLDTFPCNKKGASCSTDQTTGSWSCNCFEDQGYKKEAVEEGQEPRCTACFPDYDLSGNEQERNVTCTPKDPCETAGCSIPGTVGTCTADMTVTPATFTCGSGCKDGYIGSLCSNCTAGYTKVGIGKYAKCVCQSPNYIKGGACMPCLNGTTSAASQDSTTCICPGGNTYDIATDTCIMCESCNSTGTRTCSSPDYNCTCNPGWTGTNCDACGDRFTGAGCAVCKPAFTGPSCATCRLGLAGDNCDTCAPGYNATTNCTTCLAGYTRLTSSSACQCPANSYINASGDCRPCPLGGSSSPDSRTCSCPSPSVFNNDTIACECGTNFWRDGTMCKPCPPESSSSGGTVSSCTCIFPPAFHDRTNGKCSCNGTNIYLAGTGCLPPADPCLSAGCATNGASCTSPNGTAICTCRPGYSGTNCTECATGFQTKSGTSGATIVCECPAPGYVAINSGAQCVPDPCASSPCSATGSQPSSCKVFESSGAADYNCTCKTGYAGKNCTACDTGYGPTSNGTCGRDCSPGEGNNGADTCVTCTNNTYSLGGPVLSTNCTACGANAAVNSSYTGCDCASGYSDWVPISGCTGCSFSCANCLGNNTCGYGINAASADIVSDQGWPTCDTQRDGWKWTNTYSNPMTRNNKINWYFYSSGVAGANPAPSLTTFWVKIVRTGGSTAPWFTLYTPPQANASGWYTTRAHLYGTYANSNALDTDLPLDQEVVMFAQAQPTAQQFPVLASITKFVNYGNFSALTGSSSSNYGQLTPAGVVVGTQNISLIALSTNSGDTTGKQQWTVLAAGYQIAGSAPVTLKTGCQPIGDAAACANCGTIGNKPPSWCDKDTGACTGSCQTGYAKPGGSQACTECASGFYMAGTACQSCAPNCANCTGPTNSECSVCAGNNDKLEPGDDCGSVVVITPNELKQYTTFADNCTASSIADNLTTCTITDAPSLTATAAFVGPVPAEVAYNFTPFGVVPIGNLITETTPNNAAEYRKMCVEGGSTYREWSDTQAFDWAGKLSRWKGSVKVTVNSNCGGALLIGGALTSELAGVKLADIVKFSYRAKRESPIGSSAGNLNLQFDFDANSTTQQVNPLVPPPSSGPYSAYDTAYQGRTYFTSSGDGAWKEVVAIDKNATASTGTWVTSEAGTACASGSCSLAQLEAAYPDAAFAKSYNALLQAPVSPKIALKWGTSNSGQYIFYVDSVTIHWNVGSSLKKRTWAFKQEATPTP